MDDATVEKVARTLSGMRYGPCNDTEVAEAILYEVSAAFIADLEARKMCVVPEHPSYETQQRLCNLWCCTDEEAVDTYAEVLTIARAALTKEPTP